MDQAIAELAIVALPIVLAITLHEAAHGYVARHFGDPTAWAAGRISLNPLRHIDPFGTILVPLLIYFSSSMVGGQGLLFGWAKPVPVDFSRLRHPKRDMLWVAAAGPEFADGDRLGADCETQSGHARNWLQLCNRQNGGSRHDGECSADGAESFAHPAA
jgi:hypothetical protein